MPDPVLDRLRALAPPAPPPTAATVATVRARIAERRAPARSRRRLVAIPAALALAVPVAYVVLQGGGGTRTPTYAAAAVRAAETSPRLLLRGWTITRADEWQPGQGELEFARGGRTARVSWRALEADGKPEPLLLDKFQVVDGPVATVPGGTAPVLRYTGQTEYIARWASSGLAVEVRAVADDGDDFRALLGQLDRVDVETWLAAMPASAVRLDATAAAVTGMLRGIPVPDGLDVAAAVDAGTVRDRYQLGAAVVGSVTCTWLDRLVAARSAGDAAAEREATRALRTASTWPILHEMAASGDYPRVVEQIIQVVVDPDSADPRFAQKISGTPDGYRDALGCPRP